MIKIALIDPQYLPQVWPEILPYIARPLEYNADGLSVQEIYERIARQQFLLWIVFDGKTQQPIAAQTAELVNDANGLYCNLVTTGGSRLDEWQDALNEQIEQVARQEGCRAVRTRGRMGWFKRLKRNGYKPCTCIAEKKLTESSEVAA